MDTKNLSLDDLIKRDRQNMRGRGGRGGRGGFRGGRGGRGGQHGGVARIRSGAGIFKRRDQSYRFNDSYRGSFRQRRGGAHNNMVRWMP